MGTIQFVARQAQGYVSGRIYLSKKHEWEEAGLKKHSWRSVDDWSLNQGTKTLNVMPGKYQATIKVDGTTETTEEFTVSGTEKKQFNLMWALSNLLHARLKVMFRVEYICQKSMNGKKPG